MKKTLRIIVSIILISTFVFTSLGFVSVPLKTIKLSSSAVSIKVGQEVVLKVTLNPTNTTQKALTFSTGNVKVATVDKNGKIKGIADGKTVITVSSSANKKIFAKCNVYVIAKQTVPKYMNIKGLPIVKEPLKLKFMIMRIPSLQNNYDKMIAIQEFEKRTGVKIVWDEVTNTNVAERKNIVIASGDLPDAFIKISFSPYEIQRYGADGIFIKLNNLIEQYGSNLQALLNKYPTVKIGLTMPDGNIYSWPYIYDSLTLKVGTKFFMNKKWLDKLQIKMPSSTDEMYTVLKAFKEKDPNGNGKQDEIPLSPPNSDWLINAFRGAWGLNNKGMANGEIDIDETTGKLRFVPADEKYKDMLIYLNKLYKEELINQEIFTTDLTKLQAGLSTNTIGAYNLNRPLNDDSEPLPAAIKGPKGDQLWSHALPKLVGHYFTITKVNKYPEVTMRWLDYLNSEEGNLMWFLGIEGKTYTKTTNGDYVFVDDIEKNTRGLSRDQAIGENIPYMGGNNPTFANSKNFKGGESLPKAIEGAKAMEPYLPKEIWESFVYTREESIRFDILNSDISKYVKDMRAQFILGKADFSTWNTYIDTLRKIGIDEYLKIASSSYERYKKSMSKK